MLCETLSAAAPPAALAWRGCGAPAAQQRETAAYNQGTQSMMGAIGGLTGMAAIGATAAAGGDEGEMDKAAEWFK